MASIAELPLHSGRVPPWMLKLMEEMAEKIVEALIEVGGTGALIRGLSDPLWFQSFNNVIGMDWDSSGSTTVLTGILKSISWRRDLGFIVLGGKGGRMRLVPEEARKASEIYGLDPAALERFSRLSARVSSVMLQDGYDLYHHCVIADVEGNVVSVGQGMNVDRMMSRRYHIDKHRVEEPFSGILGSRGMALNAVSRDSREARRVFLDLVSEGPRRLVRDYREAYAIMRGVRRLTSYVGPVGEAPERRVDEKLVAIYRPVKPPSALVRRLEELGREAPGTEEELAISPSLTPSVLRALALVSHLIYSAPTSTEDPVTHTIDPYAYAYAVGGKDGVPYKYSRRTAVETIKALQEAVERAKIGDRSKIRALRRLATLIDRMARAGGGSP